MIKSFFHAILLLIGFVGLMLFLAPVDLDRPVSNFRYTAWQVKDAVTETVAAVTGREQNGILDWQLSRPVPPQRQLASLPEYDVNEPADPMEN